MAPAATDQHLAPPDPVLNDGSLEPRQQRLALLQHHVDLVSEVVVLDASPRVSVNLEQAVAHCHTSTSILDDAGAADDVDFAKFLPLLDADQIDLVQDLDDHLATDLSGLPALPVTNPVVVSPKHGAFEPRPILLRAIRPRRHNLRLLAAQGRHD